MKEVNPYLSHVTWQIKVADEPRCFLLSWNFQKKEVIFKNTIVQENKRLREHVFCRGVVLHYEHYFYDPLFPFNINLTKKGFMQFCNDYIVDVYYIFQVYDMIYVVVYNNHW